MIRKSGSPLPVGSVASQSTSACGRRLAGLVAVALAVAGVRDRRRDAAEPFDLRWLTTTVKRAPVAISSNVCASAGRLLVSMKRGSTAESSTLKVPTGATFAGL